MIAEKLCELFVAAKQAESTAKEHRLDLERQIAELFDGMLPAEGTKSLVPGGKFKLSITAKINRKLDYEAYLGMDLPENLQFVDLKPAINLKRLRSIEQIDPDLAAMCITQSPGKTSIKVVEVD